MIPPRPTRRRRRRNLLAAALVVAGSWLVASLLAVDALTRRHRPPFPEPPPAVPWGTLEALRLTASDGVEVGAWHAAGRPGRPSVVLLHGNGGCRSGCLPEAELAANAGCAVLLVTLRGHGDSGGDRNDFGFSARRDARAGVDWLAERPGGPIVLWGQSMGAAAAALFAAADGAPVRGLILECPYRDLRSATRNRTRSLLPAGLEWLTYAGFVAAARLTMPELTAISPLEAARRVPRGVPAVVMAGENDALAPPGEAAEVAAALGCDCWRVPGAGHLGLMAAEPGEYRARVLRVLGGE